MRTYTSEIEVLGERKYHELWVEYTYSPPRPSRHYDEEPEAAQIELVEVALVVGGMDRIIDAYTFIGLADCIIEKLYDEH